MSGTERYYHHPQNAQRTPAGSRAGKLPDLVCLSHLRWNFVFQRPQHLLTRCARDRRVFFVEEPVESAGSTPEMEISESDGVRVVVPRLPGGLSEEETIRVLRGLIDHLFEGHRIDDYILWYYTPMALPFTSHLNPLATVYDCMDELSLFKGAPPSLRENELRLFNRADMVFTGGQSLYEAKKSQHSSVHAFPSSVDVPHFARARQIRTDPGDQARIAHPRIGFFGVIDERMDLALIDEVAAARPGWQLVMLGPLAKISSSSLPERPNIHFLGGKSYQELPAYLAGWDVSILPFSLNDSTRFISPTKTPEYLAAGRPVVSTPIRDVVRPYGENSLVRIASTAGEFVEAIERAMAEDRGNPAWLSKVDKFLSGMSWDRTWSRMAELMDSTAGSRRATRARAAAGLANYAAAGDTASGD